MAHPTLLVTGASGHLGRRVLDLLAGSHPGRLLATTRSPGKLADLAARGVELRASSFDDDVAAQAAAFAGADHVLIISTDAIGQRAEQHRRAIAAAKQAGVRHIVYTSVTRADDVTSPLLVTPEHRTTEEALAQSGVAHTLLRNNWYTDYLLPPLAQALSSGSLVAAGGQGGAAYVTRDDCARAAAAALAQGGSSSRTLEISGPAVVTYAELAAIVSELTGRTIPYVPVTADQLTRGMIGAGLPPAIAELLVSFHVAVDRGTLALATSAVADLTGRPPTSVRDFLVANRAALTTPPAAAH
ncbi:MAG: NAD(P)-dependent oxidoreductase [Myxococcales bacterium]|nr:MAG: NAD(P)-dependent oxidoreductase [Myxococcales bacterium]